MELIFPTIEHKKQWQSFIDDFKSNNEKVIPYAARCGDGSFESFIKTITDFANPNLIENELVQSSTYFLMSKTNDKILGVANIRHKLNKNLLNVGGHIGYGVAPSERRKGYATLMLGLALEKCKQLGIEKVLVTCDKNNIGSAKTIIKNGGILENEFVEEDGNIVQRYWI